MTQEIAPIRAAPRIIPRKMPRADAMALYLFLSVKGEKTRKKRTESDVSELSRRKDVDTDEQANNDEYVTVEPDVRKDEKKDVLCT